MNEKLTKLANKVLPVANKIGNQRHIQSISSGLMYLIPFALLGAIFNIIANPPLTETIIQQGGWYSKLFSGWFHFAQEHRAILMTPSNMTMGLMSVIAVLGISFNLAKSYKMKELSTSLLALVMFLIVAAPSVPAYIASLVTSGADISTIPTTAVLDMTNLGSTGLFVAIVISLLSTEVTRFCKAKNLVIKMPSSVPPNVADSFSSVIPAIINCAVFFGVNLFSENVFGYSLPELINSVLTPAINNVNTPIAIISIITLGNLLWIFGMHGPAMMSMLYIPISFAMTGANVELVAAGKEAIFQPVYLTQFANAFFGLTVLLLIAKSKQLKAIGKVGIIPGIFLISEPVVFGTPIMFNPILAIPHLLAPIVMMSLGWIASSFGFLAGDVNIIFAQLPLGLNSFFGSMSINNVIFYFLMIPVQILIWYPFFKIYDKQLVMKEAQEDSANA